MRRHLAALAAATTLFCLLGAAPAAAHGGNPDFRSVVDEVKPPAPGLDFQILNYDADMEMVDRGHEVVIFGYEGEPYARVLKSGEVQINQRSPAAYLNENRYAEVKVPESADADAPPQWKTVDDSGTLTWHDHRTHYMATGAPPQVKDESVRTKVFDWEVPVEIDGRKGSIAGTLWWVGPADTSKTPYLIAGVAIVLLGGAAVIVARRRRRDEDGDGGDDADAGEPKEAW